MLAMLATQLMVRERVAPIQAWAWAWRIQHEYSSALREVLEAWSAKRAIPETDFAGHTAQEVAALTSSTIPQAAELLYMLERDQKAGEEALTSCAWKPYSRSLDRRVKRPLSASRSGQGPESSGNPHR